MLVVQQERSRQPVHWWQQAPGQELSFYTAQLSQWSTEETSLSTRNSGMTQRWCTLHSLASALFFLKFLSSDLAEAEVSCFLEEAAWQMCLSLISVLGEPSLGSACGGCGDHAHEERTSTWWGAGASEGLASSAAGLGWKGDFCMRLSGWWTLPFNSVNLNCCCLTNSYAGVLGAQIPQCLCVCTAEHAAALECPPLLLGHGHLVGVVRSNTGDESRVCCIEGACNSCNVHSRWPIYNGTGRISSLSSK